MKKTTIILIAIAMQVVIESPAAIEHNPKVIMILMPQQNDPYEVLWKAITQVESSNRPHVINQREQAFGIVQIRQCRIDNYNKRTGNNYTLQDCLDPNISKEVWYHYARKYGSYEKIARRWNGSGPKTDQYWNKVQKALAILNQNENI